MTRAGSAGPRFALTGRRVLFLFVAFFALVAAADGLLVYLSLSSWTGLTAKNYYKRGLEYNQVLRAAERQSNLGWRSDVAFVPEAKLSGRVTVRMVDAAGRPIDGLRFVGTVARPTHEGFDRPITLVSVGGGTYEANLTVPLPGLWELRLQATNGRDSFRFRRRLSME